MKLSTFTVGGLACGLPVEVVKEVITVDRIARVPLAPKEVAGLMNLRGQLVVSIDLRRRLGLSEAEGGSTGVVVDVGTGPVCLLVDGAGEVAELVDQGGSEPPATLTGRLRDFVWSVHELHGRSVLVLDAAGIVDVREPSLPR